MKTLTIEDLKKLIGKKVKVHDGYVAFPGAIVEVKSVVPSAGVGGYNVETCDGFISAIQTTAAK